MKTILVTGAIGSGKSEVCRYLQTKGYAVYDSDSRTKALYETVPGLKKQIEDALGIDFSRLAVIFKDSAKRETLEAIVYPLVIEDIKQWKEALVKDPSYRKRRVFVESAIATEKPLFDTLYDEVWLVEAPLEQRLARNPKAATRDALQHHSRTKANRIIVNDSTLEKLYRKI